MADQQPSTFEKVTKPVMVVLGVGAGAASATASAVSAPHRAITNALARLDEMAQYVRLMHGEFVAMRGEIRKIEDQVHMLRAEVRDFSENVSEIRGVTEDLSHHLSGLTVTLDSVDQLSKRLTRLPGLRKRVEEGDIEPEEAEAILAEAAEEQPPAAAAG